MSHYEDRFVKAFRAEQAAVGIYSVANGRFVYVSDRYCDFFGCRRDEMVGRPLDDRDLWSSPDQRKRILRELRSKGRICNVKAGMRRKTGERREALLSIETIELSGKSHYVVTLIDLDERRNLVEQLRQAQRMEAFGQLAGGLAHDYNNLLMVILGSARAIQGNPDLPPTVKDAGRQISDAAEHASSLTRQLLMFGRRRALQSRDVDLNEVVGEQVKTLQRILGNDVMLRFESHGELPHVLADTDMIEQVLTNLVANSRDAMPNGGQVTITTSRATVDEKFLQQYPEASPGEFVCITVSDTGAGIPPENLPMVFDPFFTTKESGKGTGLGLAIVCGIVRQHRGWIRVTSEPNRGATFTIFLPTAGDQGEANQAQATGAAVRGGSEGILLVEDQPLLRSIVKKVLERGGYKVFDATSGMEAFKVWEEHKDDIQLLLTDLILPDGVMGSELAQRLLTWKPNLKVIYTSGHGEDVTGMELDLQEGVNFLQKPYDLKQLGDTVRRVLDRS